MLLGAAKETNQTLDIELDSIQTIYQDKIENKIEIEDNDQTEIVQLDD